MKKISIFLILMTISISLFAQSVVKEELFKINRDSVEFINYEGPHQKFETADEIRGIGIYLASKPLPTEIKRSYNGRYSIRHLVSLDGQGLLNADVFSIEEDAVVDHIDNVRRILSGYLEYAYTYSREDSDIIAEFATYYNAVYREDFQYFLGNYNKIVTDNLTPESSGISTRYLEWPGNTEIIIPLSSSGEMKIDTDIISNNEVIEDLRTQDNKGIEPRKDIVELKEREIEEEQVKIEEQKEDLQNASRELEAEKVKLDEEAENLTDREIDERESDIIEKEIVLEAKQEDIKEQEKKQQARQEDVQKERQLIAEDEKELIEDEKMKSEVTMSTSDETFPFLLIDGDDPDLMGRLALINSQSGEIKKRSSINTVRGRRYYFLEEKILLVSGIDRAPQAVRLMLMDAKSLEVLVQGDFDVFSDTDLLINSKNIYAVVKEDDSWYIGKFNTELELQVLSDKNVLSYTPLQLKNDKLYVQLDDGKVVPLDPDTLEISVK